jgi:hypothetical protein
VTLLVYSFFRPVRSDGVSVLKAQIDDKREDIKKVKIKEITVIYYQLFYSDLIVCRKHTPFNNYSRILAAQHLIQYSKRNSKRQLRDFKICLAKPIY